MMELEIIKHKDILFRDLLRGIAVKNVAWPHPMESQVKWVIDNMQPDDMHVFLKENGQDKAYMTLSPVTATMNGVETPFMGVGCVCSANPGMGGGKSIVLVVNDFLKKNDQKGLLFCKPQLIRFYEKYNWKVIIPEKVILEPPVQGIYTMTFNCSEIDKLEYKGRLF